VIGERTRSQASTIKRIRKSLGGYPSRLTDHVSSPSRSSLLSKIDTIRIQILPLSSHLLFPPFLQATSQKLNLIRPMFPTPSSFYIRRSKSNSPVSWEKILSLFDQIVILAKTFFRFISFYFINFPIFDDL
jgi:hypothetical protein